MCVFFFGPAAIGMGTDTGQGRGLLVNDGCELEAELQSWIQSWRQSRRYSRVGDKVGDRGGDISGRRVAPAADVNHRMPEIWEVKLTFELLRAFDPVSGTLLWHLELNMAGL